MNSDCIKHFMESVGNGDEQGYYKRGGFQVGS